MMQIKVPYYRMLAMYEMECIAREGSELRCGSWV